MFNNSSPILSNDTFRIELKQYVHDVNHVIAFVQGFISIVGVLGNLLALIVINRKSLRNTSSAVFITYMAIFDTAVLLLHAFNLVRWHPNLFFHCSLTYLRDLSTFCANWVLVIMTLERCVAVYSPFLAKRFCTINSARYSMYILLTFSVIFFSVTFSFTHQISGASRTDKCRLHARGVLLIRIYQPILFYAIPDLLLLSNFFTVGALCRRRHRLSSAYLGDAEKSEMRITDVNFNRKQRQLTIMLVTVSLSFYLFTTPAMVAYTLQHYPIKDKGLHRIKQRFLFSQISVVLLQLNNATNFIFYCFAGQRFRQATMQTLYYYSPQLKTFYHRDILGDKQYTALPVSQHHPNHTTHSTISHPSSSSPYHHRCNYRTSTM